MDNTSTPNTAANEDSVQFQSSSSSGGTPDNKRKAEDEASRVLKIITPDRMTEKSKHAVFQGDIIRLRTNGGDIRQKHNNLRFATSEDSTVVCLFTDDMALGSHSIDDVEIVINEKIDLIMPVPLTSSDSDSSDSDKSFSSMTPHEQDLLRKCRQQISWENFRRTSQMEAYFTAERTVEDLALPMSGATIVLDMGRPWGEHIVYLSHELRNLFSESPEIPVGLMDLVLTKAAARRTEISFTELPSTFTVIAGEFQLRDIQFDVRYDEATSSSCVIVWCETLYGPKLNSALFIELNRARAAENNSFTIDVDQVLSATKKWVNDLNAPHYVMMNLSMPMPRNSAKLPIICGFNTPAWYKDKEMPTTFFLDPTFNVTGLLASYLLQNLPEHMALPDFVLIRNAGTGEIVHISGTSLHHYPNTTHGKIVLLAYRSIKTVTTQHHRAGNSYTLSHPKDYMPSSTSSASASSASASSRGMAI